MLRISLLWAILVLGIATIGSAQLSFIPTGTTCSFVDGQTRAYASATDFQCCNEIVDSTATNPTQCAENCAAGGYTSYINGYYRNGTFDTCLCLSCWQDFELTNANDFKSLIRHETGKTATPEIRDLAAVSNSDVQLDFNTNSSAQLVLAPNQTAVIRTSVQINGNSVQFIAIPSVSGLSLGSTFAFSAYNVLDYNGTTEAAKFRNNSFEISTFAQRFYPALQNKRQAQSDSFTYTMKNLGNELLVVLSAGTEPLTSWYYSPIAYNTDNTIMTMSGDFTFTLDVEFTSSPLYTSCFETQCTSGNILEVCANQNLIERKYCHLGCDYATRDCLQCNSTTCQGTCASSNSKCVCSDTQIGMQCGLDLSSSTIHVSGSIQQSTGTVPMPIGAYFALENCVVGNVCGTLSYAVPSISYMGIVNLSGSCCKAPLKLTEIKRSTESQSSATLVLVPDSEWTCFQGDLAIDSDALDTIYDLTVQNSEGYSNNNYWQWSHGSMSESEVDQATCDGEGIDENSPSRSIPELVVPVGVTFLVVSCVAVAGGFVGGFFKAPRGMTVKKRDHKGCLPKGNAALSRSIIAIVAVDVGVVTTMNLVGALMPISAMVIAGGILLAIMTYQYEHVGSRFNNKLRRVHQLQQVERVFGRMGAAFLIIVGIFLLLNELISVIGGMLSFLSFIFVGIIGWFYLALYVTWVLVAVHFAGAIYISVCYYYTAARTDEQESIQDHKMEMDEHNETEP